MAQKARSTLISEIEILLGSELIDVPLKSKSLNLAVDMALSRYRQRSTNSVEESYVFMTILEDTNDYVLPQEIIEVRQIFRRQFGLTANSSDGQFDPFDLAYTNLYVLQSGSLGGLATYDFYQQNVELAGRMFGYHYNFSWNPDTKRLKIMRNPRADEEEVLLWVYNEIPEDQLITNVYSGSWIRNYALAHAKMILGQAYEKFSSLPGPQGGVTLNGSQLKAEGQQEIEKLDEEIKKYSDGGTPLGIVMG